MMPPRSKDSDPATAPTAVRGRRRPPPADSVAQLAPDDRDGVEQLPDPVEPAPTAQTSPVSPAADQDSPGGAPVAQDAQDGPVLVLAGTFAIYEDGKGGLMLVVTDPDGNVTHKHIPAAVVGMAKGGGMMGRMLGLKGLLG